MLTLLQFSATEEAVSAGVQWLRLLVETIGAVIIGFGILAALWGFVRTAFGPVPHRYNVIRITFAKHLALALEFQLAADILSTAIAPSWDQIGKLGAIAVIRTALNYFLSREIQAEQRQIERGRVEEKA